MTFNQQQDLDALQALIRRQYNYGFARQTGRLARRSIHNPLVVRDAPLPRRSKARRYEHWLSDERRAADGGGYWAFHPLVREAFVAGCADGDRGRYRSDVVVGLQRRAALPGAVPPREGAGRYGRLPKSAKRYFAPSAPRRGDGGAG